MNSLPNEIEPIVEIINYSFYIFLTIPLIGIIILYFTMKFLLKLLKRKDETIEIGFKILNELDFNNSKDSAYKISKYGRTISVNGSHHILDELISDLEKYKYKKYVESLDEDIKYKLKEFLEVVKNEQY